MRSRITRAATPSLSARRRKLATQQSVRFAVAMPPESDVLELTMFKGRRALTVQLPPGLRAALIGALTGESLSATVPSIVQKGRQPAGVRHALSFIKAGSLRHLQS